MQTFEIKEEFLVDGKPTKLISGAIHYFRMTPAQWEDSLYNLKALGANTIETYIPWNLHEPVEGVYDFEGMKDIVAFVSLAQELGLMVILRPSVYICAEWEFGGLPAWLLKEHVRLRSTDPRFIAKVRTYFSVLLPKLVPLQVTHGGPVIMMQVENEYGSYGMEKEYLRQTKQVMEEFGIDSISRTEALDFQADYELDQITMIPEIHQLLLALHKNRIPIGILTNGPVDLQSRKLQNIGAYQYFEKQNIIISSPLTEELQKIAMKVM